MSEETAASIFRQCEAAVSSKTWTQKYKASNHTLPQLSYSPPQNPKISCACTVPLLMLLATFSAFLLAQRKPCKKLFKKRHFTIKADFKYGLHIQVK
jgi:hypothetical protein